MNDNANIREVFGCSEEKALNVLCEKMSLKSRMDMSLIDIYKGESTFVQGMNEAGQSVTKVVFDIYGVDTSKLTGGSSFTPTEGLFEMRTVGQMMGQLCDED